MIGKTIEYLPETNHDECHKKEALKNRCRRLGLDPKTTNEEEVTRREAAVAARGAK